MGLDLGYFLKSGFWVSFRYVFISFSGLILSIGFARLGSRELFGQYQSLLAFIALVSIFSLPGLAVTAFRSATEGRDWAMVQVVRYSFYASFLALPFIFGYAFYSWYWLGETTYALGLFLGGIFFPFLYSTNKWYVIYEAHSLFRPVAWRSMLLSASTTLSIVVALFFHQGLLFVLLLYFFFTAFLNGIFFLEAKRRVVVQEENQMDMRYTLLVSLQKFIFSLSESLPVLSISFLFGFEMLALFQVAYLLVSAVAGFLGGIAATYLPLLFRYKTFAHGKIFFQHLIIGVVLFLVLRVFIEVFFLDVYGEAYREALVIAECLSWLVILLPMRSFLINYFTAKDKNQHIIIILIIANILSFGTLLYLKDISFQMSVVAYSLALQITFILPLLWYYFADAKTQNTPKGGVVAPCNEATYTSEVATEKY